MGPPLIVMINGEPERAFGGGRIGRRSKDCVLPRTAAKLGETSGELHGERKTKTVKIENRLAVNRHD